MASISYNKARGTWLVSWHVAGRNHGKTFPKDRKREARAWAAKVEAEKPKASAAVTLETAAVYFCEDRLACCEASTYERYRCVILALVAALGPATTLHRITQHQLAEWRNARLKVRARTTVRNDFKTAIAFFRWCRARRWLESLPTDGIEPPHVKRTVPEFLAPDALEKLLAHIRAEAPPEWYLLATLAADAGLRRNEALFLPWSSVDFPNRQLTIVGKSKAPRIVPMTHRVEQMLLDWPQAGPTVFPAKYGAANKRRSPDLARRFNLWLHAHGYKITLHGLRHSFAVRLVSRGASERAVGDLLGHQDLTTVRIYARAPLDYLRSIIEPPPHPAPPPSPATPPTDPPPTPGTTSGSSSENMQTTPAPPAASPPTPWPKTPADTRRRAQSPRTP